MGVNKVGRSEAAVSKAKAAIAIDLSEPDRAQALVTCRSKRTMLSDCRSAPQHHISAWTASRNGRSSAERRGQSGDGARSAGVRGVSTKVGAGSHEDSAPGKGALRRPIAGSAG